MAFRFLVDPRSRFSKSVKSWSVAETTSREFLLLVCGIYPEVAERERRLLRNACLGRSLKNLE